MYVKVDKPSKGGNAGSCAKLVNYLNKDQNTSFFDRNNNTVDKQQVQEEIDGNTSALGANENKFYELSINPSQNELKHLIGRNVNDFEDLTASEKSKLFEDLKAYTHDVMDIYASNFERPDVKDGNDILYFARIETERTYKHTDTEVQDGSKRVGDKKEGLNLHVHIIVSRKSKDGKVKLSPNGKYRGSNWNRNGKTVRRGFNHNQWKKLSIRRFNQRFHYQSQSKEGYQSNRMGQNGNRVAGQIKGQAKGTVMAKVQQELLKGNLQRETRTVGQAQRAVTAIINPKLAIKREVIRMAKNALKFATGTKDL